MTIDVWREIATGLAGVALSAGVVVALEAAAAPGLAGVAVAAEALAFADGDVRVGELLRSL